MGRRRRPWFFMVVWLLVSASATGHDGHDIALGDGLCPRLAPMAGVVLGAIWQLVDRRDLANRLSLAAVFFVVAALLQAAFGGLSAEIPALWAQLGIVAGLVLAEQVLRRSNARQRVTESDPRAGQPPSQSFPVITRRGSVASGQGMGCFVIVA